MKNFVLSPEPFSGAGYLIVNEFVEENILLLHTGMIMLDRIIPLVKSSTKKTIVGNWVVTNVRKHCVEFKK